MTESQIQLMQMLMRENEKLGKQLDIALECSSWCAENKLLADRVNKALQSIVKIGE